MDIVQRAQQRPAPHVVAALAVIVQTHIRPIPHPTPRRGAARRAGQVVAGPAEA